MSTLDAAIPLDAAAIRVVRGAPSDAELAAIVAVLHAVTRRAPVPDEARPRRAAWAALAGHRRKPATSWRTPGLPPGRT